MLLTGSLATSASRARTCAGRKRAQRAPSLHRPRHLRRRSPREPAAVRCETRPTTDPTPVWCQLGPAPTDPPAIRGELRAATDPRPIGCELGSPTHPRAVGRELRGPADP